MKMRSALLGIILGAAALFAAVPGTAFADARSNPAAFSAPAEAAPPVSALPGTDAESRDYEHREAESPQVQEFAGGEVIIGFFVLVLIIVLIVLLID